MAVVSVHETRAGLAGIGVAARAITGWQWHGIVNLGGGVVTGMLGGSSVARVEGAPLVGTGAPSYKGFRFPAEIISHCVWLYYRFPLSFREVEEMMLQRGIVVSPPDRPAVVREIRPDLRQRATQPPGTSPGGDVAPRRGLHQDQRHESLSLAGGGPARQRLGHPGHLPPRRQGRDQVLP